MIIEYYKGNVAGYVAWKIVGKPQQGLIELTRIEVLPEYRHKGVATKLFKRMLKEIEFRKLFLTTHISNYKARKFYRKMGMKYEARLKDHYYTGEDEIVYSMFR